MKKFMTFAAVSVLATSANAAIYELTDATYSNAFGIINTSTTNTFLFSSVSSDVFTWDGSSDFTVTNLTVDAIGIPGFFEVDADYTADWDIAASGNNAFTASNAVCDNSGTGGTNWCGNIANPAPNAAMNELQGVAATITMGTGSFTWSATGGNPAFQSLELTFTEVPVPAAAWLFGSALLGLGGVARRRKAS